MADPEPAYPAHREADIALRDGSTVHVRPVRPTDRELLLEFYRSLSTESRALRFFSASVDLDRAADTAVAVDHHDRAGLVALGRGGHVLGNAMYLRTGEDRAEVAFAVVDEVQGQGLGTILLGHLAEWAEENGVVRFEAETLPENHRMIEVFRESGFAMEMHAEPGLVTVEFPTSLSPAAIERFERREQTAAVAAMRAFLSPASVAVVGASRSRGTIGGEVFHNLLEGGFAGPVYPVNPKTDVVQSVRAYQSLTDVPGPVDLAVIVVPAETAVEAARECAAKGVRSLVVISSGFAEIGEEGRDRQQELVAVCRESGMRMIGPNCMGILNTSPEVQLNATFAPWMPPPGRVGFMSQSGALGIAVIDRARSLGLGLSSFVSVGNKADISGNDLMHFWESDPETDVILLYLESFGNPRKFTRFTRRVGRAKPILAVKSGRGTAGARATSSHTGALIAASDVTVDALFRQAGVIRCDTLEELLDVASLLAVQPAPAGPRVGIVTNAGGLGILCADACEAEGLEVPSLPDAVREELASFLPREASTANPVDLIASATAEDYGRAVEAIAASGAVDAIVVIFIPPLVTRGEDVAREVGRAAEGIDERITLLGVFMAASGAADELAGGAVRIPSFEFPEEAARVLGHAARYGRWRRSLEGTVPKFEDVRPEEAAGIIARALADGPRWLRPDETAKLLSCYGLPLAEWRLTEDAEAAGDAAEEIGGPVALKAIAPTLVHKTEAGGVRLALEGRDAVINAAREMSGAVEAAGHEVEAFLVQRMVPSGVEMLLGMVHDRLFGPVVAVGAGGTAVELLKDVSVRITPLTDLDADDMVRSLATFPLLEGYRGGPKADLDALREALLRLSALVEAHPAIAEMDLNPVMALTDGAAIVDARVRIEIPAPRPPLSARL